MSYVRKSKKSDFYIWCGIYFHCIYSKENEQPKEYRCETLKEMFEFVTQKVSEGYKIPKSVLKDLQS